MADAVLRPFGLILAGGRSSRMGGGDKALLSLGGETLLSRIVDRVLPQCIGLAVNANGDTGRFGSLVHPLIPDRVEDDAGPLAGVLAGLAYLRHTREAEWLLTVPGDTPFIPPDLVQRLAQALRGDPRLIAHAQSGGRAHPLVALWHVSLFEPLRIAVEEQAVRRVTGFQAERGAIAVVWPTEPIDPFFNVNTPDDLADAQGLAKIMGEHPIRETR